MRLCRLYQARSQYQERLEYRLYFKLQGRRIKAKDADTRTVFGM